MKWFLGGVGGGGESERGDKIEKGTAVAGVKKEGAEEGARRRGEASADEVRGGVRGWL